MPTLENGQGDVVLTCGNKSTVTLWTGVPSPPVMNALIRNVDLGPSVSSQ
jgi:hypothetical protein